MGWGKGGFLFVGLKKTPVAGRGRDPDHRERWVAAKLLPTASSRLQVPIKEPSPRHAHSPRSLRWIRSKQGKNP